MLRQPIVKRQRRLNIHLFPKADKYLQRRPYPPGVRGPAKPRRPLSEYGLQLREKQRAKFTYGLTERQFQKLFNQAQRARQNIGDALLTLLERRLDNVIFRAGLAATRPQARQWISHGLIRVNQTKNRQPSYLVKSTDVIDLSRPKIARSSKGDQIPGWLKPDYKKKTISVVKLPSGQEITTDLEPQLVVEFYSR